MGQNEPVSVYSAIELVTCFARHVINVINVNMGDKGVLSVLECFVLVTGLMHWYRVSPCF